jgi:hypothetical protein
VAVGDDCWECEECSLSASHYDYLEVDPEFNHYMGGTFVNMCGIAYSECWPAHTMCPPIIGGDGEEIHFTSAQLDLLQESVLNDDIESIRTLTLDYAQTIYVDSQRHSIQVTGCGGRIIAHLPLGEKAMIALGAAQ